MKTSVLLVSVLCLLATVCLVEACNEAVCASLVSKCQLIKSCECDMTDKKNCTCCGNCQVCLAQLYTECCSCVGMCPLPNPEDSIFKTSTIEVLSDPIPELFNVLTEEEDYLKRWTTHRYPVYFDSLYSKNSNHGMTGTEFSQRGSSMSHIESAGLYNCTVAFMSQCMSLKKCKQSCKSMGSAKYRWFHDQGCCQCIGESCIDYGLNEAKCLQCMGDEEDEEGEGEGKDKEKNSNTKEDLKVKVSDVQKDEEKLEKID